MGIERFFNSLTKNESIKEHGIVIGLKYKLNAEYLYLDFNSIIYNVITKIENDLSYLLYSLVLSEVDNKPLDEKSIEISKIFDFDITSKPLIEKYNQFFNQVKMDQCVIDQIKEQVIYISTQLVTQNKLKTIFVSLDGVPNMGKIIEQKKRRYNGYILTRLKKKIYQKYEETMTDKRKKFEDNKKHYDRSKIISWTIFVENIVNAMNSESFKKTLKQHHENLTEIIISDHNSFGEGEKKIMEHIIENKKKGDYVIYSPDADVIILTMIAHNMLKNESNFTVLRFNQQSLEYDTVNVNALIKNIYDYVIKKVQNNDELSTISVTNDIAFIFTLFGNDFIPKIESIDARNDIETLINIYSDMINNLKVKKCLIFNEKENFKINYYVFFKFINELAKIENMLLFDTYMNNKYKNYGFYKRELEVERLYPVLETYIEFANNIFDKIREVYKNDITDENIQNCINEIIKNSDKKMIKMFLIVEGKIKKDNINNDDLNNLFKKQINKIIEYAKNNDSTGKNIVSGRLRLLLFEDSIDSDHHRENIKKDMPHSEMEITEYDNEIYKMEKRLGEYLIKLNATDFDLGSLSISLFSNGNYRIDRYNIIGNIMDYYSIFFNIESSVILLPKTNKKIIVFEKENRKKLDNLVFDYLKGLFWVFDFYFNKNNNKYNVDNISTWFYPYHRAPLLFQVREVLSSILEGNNINRLNSYMNKLFYDISLNENNKASNTNYMTKLEHYLYVTPKTKHIAVPDNYKSIIDKNNNLFPDLDTIVDKIWNNDSNDEEIIECKRVPYINKCNLTCVPFIKFTDYMKIMNSVNENKQKGGFYEAGKFIYIKMI